VSNRIAFTDLTLKSLPLPAKGQARFWDTSLPGFGVRVSQGGTKTFILLDPRAKDRTQETIGRYPVISLADARHEAKRRLAEFTLGKHRPKSERWDTALAQYLAEKEKKRRASTLRWQRSSFKHFNFGTAKLADIGPSDIQKRLDRLTDRPAAERAAFVALRTFFTWALQKHYLEHHPMRRMKAPEVGKSRERVLSDEELGRIWRACPEDNFGRLVKVLILTGVRRGEAAELSPNMLGDGRITLPGELAKNKRTHVLPLSPHVRELVEAGTSWGGFTKSKAELERASGIENWCLHDIRRSVATGLASLGTPVVVTEKILNHASGSLRGVAGVYNRFDYMPEMREALAKWEARVWTLTKKTPEPQADDTTGVESWTLPAQSKPAAA
jgi:integrase